MILPTKHINEEFSLLGLGGSIIRHLEGREMTVSLLWEEYNSCLDGATPVSFDWFVLSLDFLYSINAIELKQGVIRLRKNV